MSSYPAIEIQNITEDNDPIDIVYDFHNPISLAKKTSYHFEMGSSHQNTCSFQDESCIPTEIRLTGPLHRKEHDNHTHELVIRHTNHLYMCFFVYNNTLPNYHNLASLNPRLDNWKNFENDDFELQSLLSPSLEKLDKMYYQTKNNNHVLVFSNAIYTSKLPPIVYSQKSAIATYKEIYMPNEFNLLSSLFSLNDDTKIQPVFPQGNIQVSETTVEGFGGGKKRRQRRRRKDASAGAAAARAIEDAKSNIKNLIKSNVDDAIKQSITDNADKIKTMTMPNEYIECDLLEDDGKGTYKDTIVMPLGAGAYEQGATMFMSFMYFFLIGAVICIGSPYMTLIAIKHAGNSYSKVLTVVWGLILLIGVILVAVALAPKTTVRNNDGSESDDTAAKKLTKKKRILLSTLGFFFIVMFGFSFLSNTIAKMSGTSYATGFSFSDYYDKEKLTYQHIFDIYALSKPSFISNTPITNANT
jgi:hypothetical protein